ncbi:MAG: metalloregulator ArsR/SmtB family transcription factor [Bacteroidales bacterium]|nr:metalloregulator ArsR/SmtB family transcription factor [Bacteroidales bacterium]
MAYSKNNLFSTELQEYSEFYKALAHPARLAILKYIANSTTCITGDLADELPLVRTTVNQHLKGLKDAGLIIGTTEGLKPVIVSIMSDLKYCKENPQRSLNRLFHLKSTAKSHKPGSIRQVVS